MKPIRVLLCTLLPMLLVACEKLTLPKEDMPPQPQSNLTLSVFQLEQTPFAASTRATASDVCTRVNFGIYDTNGTRLKQTNQKLGDEDFGTASFQLPEGTYQLVVVAHSSNGNPTMTDPAKIQFSNITEKGNGTGYSDTFLYNTMIKIGSEPQTMSLTLHRIVALCRFVIEDKIPEGVAKLRFQYKGGSGHFNASTGLGVTKSTQTIFFPADDSSQKQFDLYTFLHDTEGSIHLLVTAYDAADNLICEREFDIPLQQNRITWFSGTFFTGKTPVASQQFTSTLSIDEKWKGEIRMTY
ncbi:MAG: FimB/Mfa2 family fimbrial subunit [Bacteroidaceae bacterium]|nr:FimB/Mfa2 family fimbrial subunit [Bacteroidaceae bacterium]